MKKMWGLALLGMLALAGCGGDDDTPTAPVVPPPPITNYSGTYQNSQLWLVAFERASDGWRSQYYCPGNMTLAQGATTTAGTAPITGFGVATSPCPSLTFEITGTVAADGTIQFSADGPRPLGCPPSKATYSGLFAGRQLSARGSTSIECSGETQGTHRFDYVITAFKNN